MKKYGFTLVELLAVIVVLAIISLIATPMVIKYIEQAQKISFTNNARNLVKQAQMNCITGNSCFFLVDDGKLYKSDSTYRKKDYITSTGGYGEIGKIIIDDDGLGYLAIYNHKWCAKKADRVNDIDIVDYVEGECKQLDLYTVTFDPNGGRVDQTSKLVKLNENYGELPAPTREGYTFKGWNGKNMFDSSRIIAYDNVTVSNGVVTQVKSDSRTDLQWKIQKFLDGTYLSQIEFYVMNDIGSVNLRFEKDSSFNAIRFGLNGAQRDTTIRYSVKDFVDNKNYVLSFNVTNITQGSVSWNNIQIEEGDTATEYEPYYITSTTKVVQNKNHTLKAIWEKNS